MKRYLVFLCFFIVFSPGIVWSEGAKKVAVLPFSIHSSEDINYVRDGIWDMLISRMSAGEGINVSTKEQVKEALLKLEGREPAIADVYGIGKTIDVDYAVWGSITKIGANISIDAKLLDVSNYKTPIGVFEQCKSIDDVIPRINDFSKKINAHVLGIALPQAEQGILLPEVKGKPIQSMQPLQEDQVIQTSKGTFTSVTSNTAFIKSSNPLSGGDFWMSPQYRKSFVGMDIGDVYGDKKNEVVVIDRNTVYIYQKNGNEFVLREKMVGEEYYQYLSVDVVDMNGNGIDEIIVTSFSKGSLASFVMEFRDGEFGKIAYGLEWFMRVINTPEGPLLIGQELPVGDPPFSDQIFEITCNDNNSYRKGDPMFIPEGLSVFGVMIEKVDSGIERVVSFGENDHINIFRKTKTPLSKIHVIGGSDDLVWNSDDVFGGSNNKLDFSEHQAPVTSGEESRTDRVYIKNRILSYDTDGDGKKEIIVVKNLSPTGRVLKNVRVFTSAELYALEWDGLGLAENWRTKKIQGYVSDYQIKDIDNDGKDEVVLALGLGSSLSRSVIVVYEMNVE